MPCCFATGLLLHHCPLSPSSQRGAGCTPRPMAVSEKMAARLRSSLLIATTARRRGACSFPGTSLPGQNVTGRLPGTTGRLLGPGPRKNIQQLTTDVVQENSPGQRSEMFRRENGIRGGIYTPGEVGTMSCAPWRAKSLLLLLPGKLSSVTKRKESKGKSENSVWQWHLDCLRPRRVSKRSVDRQHVLLAALDPVIMHPRV